MKVKGRLVRVDLGAGGWYIETRGGRVEIFGDVPIELAGKDVVAVGDPVEGFSTSMAGSGKAIELHSIQAG